MFWYLVHRRGIFFLNITDEEFCSEVLIKSATLLSRTSCRSRPSMEDCEARAESGSCGGAPPATTAPCGAAREAAATARRRLRPPTTPPQLPPPPTRSPPPSPRSPAPRRGTSWPSGKSGPPSASRLRSGDSWYLHLCNTSRIYLVSCEKT